MPYTFSVNWRFTRKKQWVRFTKGEPIGFFFPVKRETVEAFEPKLMKLSDAPDVQKQYVTARMQRNLGRDEPHRQGARAATTT